MSQLISNENKYYVYEHWIDGKCFYVGSGNYNRAYNFYNRSKKWKNIVKDRKDEVVVKIIEIFENRSDAFDFERALTIYNDYILKNNLINFRTGAAAFKERNPMYGKSVVDYMSKETHEQWLEKHRNYRASKETKEKMSRTRLNQKRGKYKRKRTGISPITAHFLNENRKIEFETAGDCYKYFEGTVSKPLILSSIQGKEVKKLEKLKIKFTQEKL